MAAFLALACPGCRGFPKIIECSLEASGEESLDTAINKLRCGEGGKGCSGGY